jgi:hypothetical protein
MDPQGNPIGSTNYPDPSAAALFARNLAARLAGDHVIFSPSFDDKLSLTRTLLDTVGSALRDAAPRHLLTAHLAGGSSICDYYDMHNATKHPWHQLHIFQSGHAISQANCLAGETAYQCTVRRARDFPDQLSPTPTIPPPTTCIDPGPSATNVQPNANGEAAYDDTYTTATTQTVNSPYGVRHTGYNSALNGAFGVTLGVIGIYDWTNVSTVSLESDGSKHMKILGDQFNLSPWQMLQRRSLRVKNEPPDTQQDQKMIMAATLDNNLAMIYLPNNDEVCFDGSFLNGFDCASPSTWSVSWINPRAGDSTSAGVCQNISDSSGATRRITRPACLPQTEGVVGNCDWLVVLRRSGFYPPSASPRASALNVWSAPTEDGSGWRILGRLKNSLGQDTGGVVPISEPTLGTRLKLPVTAQDSGGNFVVAWESEDDGDLHGIFLQRINGQGRLLDHKYPVNVTKEYDQTNPWVATDPLGLGGVVTWTSYAQDGDSGGIFARLLNPAGVPHGQEIQVNEHTAGRQDFSKATIDAEGNLFVAWTSDSQDGDAEGVYGRRFDPRGNPLSPEFRVNTSVEGAQWLTDVAWEVQGDVLVTWTSYASDGRELGIFGQRYNTQGSPLGGEFLVVSPPTGTL